MAYGNYDQGKFTPINPQKYVGNAKDICYRSRWELHFMRYCDGNPAVVQWTSEYPIKYYHSLSHKTRRYFVDFFMKVRGSDGTEKTLMIEIKPESQTKPPKKPINNNAKSTSKFMNECITYQTNVDKWEAAADFAARNGLQFLILNEYDLGIAKRGSKKTQRS
jgi:hypothetical protein